MNILFYINYTSFYPRLLNILLEKFTFLHISSNFHQYYYNVLLVQGKYKRFTLSSGNKEGWCVFIFPSIPSPDLCLGKLNLKHIKTHRKLEFFIMFTYTLLPSTHKCRAVFKLKLGFSINLVQTPQINVRKMRISFTVWLDI